MNLYKVFIIVFCCWSTLSLYAQEIMYEGENNGIMMLQVSEFNIKKKEAVEQAIKDAYFQILFRGIPGSKEYGRALLGTDENDMNKHHQYYDNMINNGRLYTFINYSALTYYKKKEAVVKLTVNMQAIVSDMERNNLYKRFGLY